MHVARTAADNYPEMQVKILIVILIFSINNYLPLGFIRTSFYLNRTVSKLRLNIILRCWSINIIIIFLNRYFGPERVKYE